MGTLHAALSRLEQEGSIASDWGASENNRRTGFYRLTAAGRKHLQTEAHDWMGALTVFIRVAERHLHRFVLPSVSSA